MSSLDALASHGIDNAVIAIGVFDGVHRGHQLLLSRLREMAEAENATPVAFTFYPHPKQVLNPSAPPELLVSPEKKVELLHDYGMKAVVTMPFTKSFASLEPDEFIRECLITSRVNLRGICVGRQWRFGAKGRGNVEVLEKFAENGHFAFAAVDEFTINGKEVSSTAIRRAISSGRLHDAEQMLGRPYCLQGTVAHGYKVAGKELECPTANLEFRWGVIPPHGVYAGRAIVEGKSHASAVAVGVSPTFQGHRKGPRVEVHLFDFSGDIYGNELQIEFIEYLREERCYSSPEALKTQIGKDIGQIRKILARRAKEAV